MFAVLIAWLVLNELPSGIQLVGGVFIVGGVALVRMDELRAGPGPAAPAPPAPALAGER